MQKVLSKKEITDKIKSKISEAISGEFTALSGKKIDKSIDKAAKKIAKKLLKSSKAKKSDVVQPSAPTPGKTKKGTDKTKAA